MNLYDATPGGEVELLTESVGNPRRHAVWKHMGDPIFVLRLGQDDDPHVPQMVNRHLD